MKAFFKDRKVEFPNRKRINPVPDQPNVYDISDVPGAITEEGTPLNVDTFSKITPNIGANGNWYVGSDDTGVCAKGDTGLTPNIAMAATAIASNLQPTVSKGGTKDNPIFTIGIPIGDVAVAEALAQQAANSAKKAEEAAAAGGTLITENGKKIVSIEKSGLTPNPIEGLGFNKNSQGTPQLYDYNTGTAIIGFSESGRYGFGKEIMIGRHSGAGFDRPDAIILQSDNILLERDDCTYSLLDLIYPVGAIYMSVKNVSPASTLGGTWVTWGAGRVPLGIGNNGETNYTTAEQIGGGEKSVALHNHIQNSHGHTHTITEGTGTTGINNIQTSSEKNTHSHGLNSPDASNRWSGNTNSFTNSNNSNRYVGALDNNSAWSDNYGGRAKFNAQGHGYTETVTIENNKFTATNIEAGIDKGNRMPFITCYMWKRTA